MNKNIMVQDKLIINPTIESMQKSMDYMEKLLDSNVELIIPSENIDLSSVFVIGNDSRTKTANREILRQATNGLFFGGIESLSSIVKSAVDYSQKKTFESDFDQKMMERLVLDACDLADILSDIAKCNIDLKMINIGKEENTSNYISQGYDLPGIESVFVAVRTMPRNSQRINGHNIHSAEARFTISFKRKSVLGVLNDCETGQMRFDINHHNNNNGDDSFEYDVIAGNIYGNIGNPKLPGNVDILEKINRQETIFNQIFHNLSGMDSKGHHIISGLNTNVYPQSRDAMVGIKGGAHVTQSQLLEVINLKLQSLCVK